LTIARQHRSAQLVAVGDEQHATLVADVAEYRRRSTRATNEEQVGR
jgi:hypothetical protein